MPFARQNETLAGVIDPRSMTLPRQAIRQVGGDSFDLP
jgi:hypothetical protein